MYQTAGVVLGIYLILGFLSRKEEVGETKQKILIPFARMGMFLYKRACIRKLSIFSNRQVAKDLERTHPGENTERLCTLYYVEKLSLSLLLFLAGTLLGTLLFIKSQSERVLDDSGGIVRGSYQDPKKELELEAILGSQTDAPKQIFHIQVEPQRLTAEQAQELYSIFREELLLVMAGGNENLWNVTEDLNLVEFLEGYPFMVEWESNRPDLVSASGTVWEVEEAEMVCLSAEIVYEDMEWKEEFSVRLTPVQLSPSEELHRELEELLAVSEQTHREQEIWKLPDDFNGQQIVWSQVSQDNSILLWAGGLMVAVLVYFLADKDLHDKLEERKRKMKLEYPDVVQKLALYLGAGMTVRGTFLKVAGEYEHKRGRGGRESFILEEMLYICRELQAGISEGAAYEHFGRRTGLQEYIRLSTLLQQNLKKGNSALLTRLREEADQSMQERTQNCRRMGEEAVTKLLVPMVMMLLVVMVMIMIPAFSSTVM